MLNLQTFNVAPRDDHNPRRARLDDSRLSTGRDGVLYKMADRRDWEKYRTLSGPELDAEMRRSQEVKQNLMTFSGQTTYSGAHRKQLKDGFRMVAPQFGTNTRDRRIETRKWDKELSRASQGMSTQGMDSKFRSTLSQLQENTENLPTQDVVEEFEYVVDPKVMSGQDKVTQVFGVIKQKYEQNLHVIDQLYDERLSLEQYAKSLEQKLVDVTGEPVENLIDRADRRGPIEYTDDDSGRFAGRSERPFSRGRPSSAAAPPSFDEVKALLPPASDSSAGLNPWQAADMLVAPRWADEPRAARGRSRQRTPPPSSQRSQSLPRTQTAPSTHLRSHSASRSVGISPHLQADIDRYVQKRELSLLRESQQEKEEKEQEAQRRERFLRASRSGKEFVGMAERQRTMAEEREERMHALALAEKEKALAERRAREEKKRKEGELMATALSSSMSWQELQDTEAAKRRENIEARKHELLLMSQLPPALAESAQRAKRTSRSAVVESPTFKPQVSTEEPDVVARRLSRQQKAWSQRLEQTKEKLREQFLSQRSQTMEGGSASSDQSKMEARAAQCKARRDARLKALEERKQEEKEARERKEREHNDRLLNMKLPDGSLKATKSAQLREGKVKNELLMRELDEQREKRLREKQELKLREAAASLRSVLQERDEDRKARNPNARLEVSAAEQESKERAARAREEFRAKLRDNKQRIRESLKNRPSLLERHDQGVANRTAATEALRTFTQIVSQPEGADDLDDLEAMLSKPSSRKNSNSQSRASATTLDSLLQGDDIFDRKEKAIVKTILSKE